MECGASFEESRLGEAVRPPRPTFAAIVVALLCAPAGCASGRSQPWRAEAGLCVGLGAEASVVGVLRAGVLGIALSKGVGHVYGGDPNGWIDGWTLGPLYFRRGAAWAGGPDRREAGVGLLHGLWAEHAFKNVRAHVWSLDVTMALGFFFFRLGFDPVSCWDAAEELGPLERIPPEPSPPARGPEPGDH